MANQTRRKFLKQASVGAATVGVVGAAVAVAPRLTTKAASSDAAAELSATKLSGPLMLYVRDVAKGEIGILIDTREIVYRDTDLVLRIIKATQ